MIPNEPYIRVFNWSSFSTRSLVRCTWTSSSWPPQTPARSRPARSPLGRRPWRGDPGLP
jgi:hypothetical protein